MASSSRKDDNAQRKAAAAAEARQTFWNVAWNSLGRLADAAPAAWKGRQARYYRQEQQQVFQRHFTEPLYTGLVVTTFLFATFRISGSRTYRQLYERYYWKSSTHHAKKEPTTSTTSPSKTTWTSHLQKQEQAQQHLRLEAVRLPTDALVSILAGLSSILWLSQPRRLQQDLAEAPLLPGKSLIYEHVCPEMVQAYHHHNQQQQQHSKAVSGDRNVSSHDDISLDENDDFVLATFYTLVQNCEIRSRVIQQRRQEQLEHTNDASNEIISRPSPPPQVIPYPGIRGISRYPPSK